MNYYYQFIPNFFKIAALLNNLIRKELVKVWDDIYNQAFKELKYKISTELVLIYFYLNKEIVIEYDISNIIVSRVLL